MGDPVRGDPARGGRSRGAALVAGVVLVATTSLAGVAAADNDAARVELTWTDDRIAESSGLAFAGDLLVTTNDSGDGPTLYVVDPATGETVGTTTYEVPEDLEPVDVEALAPVPGRSAVWVGDVGDNRAVRSTVVLHRVPVAGGDRTVPARSVVLAYADGAHDAETLLSDPRTGRLHVVTKSLVGGTVYAAPRDLSPFVADADGVPRSGEPGVLEAVGRVPGFLTDGVLLRGGAGVLLRDYAGATAYTWPGLERITPVGLPAMRQGEAVALRGARLWASTEGTGTEVVSVPLPPVLRAREAGRGVAGAPEVGPGDGPTEAPVATAPPYATQPAQVVPPWLARVLPVAVVGTVAVVLGWFVVVGLRRRRAG